MSRTAVTRSFEQPGNDWRAGIIVVALSVVRWIASVLPIAFVSSLGGVIARALGPGTQRDRRALQNIRRAFPEFSPARRRVIADEMWTTFGRTVAESLILDRIARSPDRVTFADPDAAHRLSNLNGAVLVGLHFGNWEVGIIPALRLGQKPLALYNPIKDAMVDEWLRSLRRQLYPAGLLPASRSSVLRAVRHVRAGGTLTLLVDHRDRSGTVVPFFAQPAPSSTLPALLHVTFGARILVGRVDRQPGARFMVHFEEIIVPRTSDASTHIQQTTAAIQAVFERWIRERPGQWIWFYKRWL